MMLAGRARRPPFSGSDESMKAPTTVQRAGENADHEESRRKRDRVEKVETTASGRFD